MRETRFNRIVVIALIILAGSFVASAAERPNIIIIMGDDMGYSDIGCYGGEIGTPHLDRLAKRGLRFTSFYNTARCCPTRASLLTGLYPHQAGVGWMTADNGFDGYRGDLNNTSRTIAEVLGTAGYRTYMAGKWHVTKHDRFDAPQFNWPLQRGFEKFYGTISGAGSFWDPWSLVRQNKPISCYADPEYQPETYYYTHAISDHAVRFVKEHEVESPDKPFFMYVAYTAAHWPMHALPDDIEKYKGRYDSGFESIRETRYRRMQKMGLLDARWELSPGSDRWAAVENKEWDARNMEVYAAMVDSMDQGIGSIMKALADTEQLDNTLVLYLQDNGGCAEGLGRRPRGGLTEKPPMATLPLMKPTDLQTQMIPAQTRDGFPIVMGPGVMAGPDGTYAAYGRGWANVSNTPFREYKHWVHEGGISTPLIAHWPDGIKRKGKLESQPGHLVDLMATCVDLSRAEYPVRIDDRDITPLEGRSLVPAFSGQIIQREALFWEHEGNRAVRMGDWKLVAKGENGKWELYNLKNDRSEMHELSESMPEKTEQLKAKWMEYAKRANVLPLNPRNRPRTSLNLKKIFDLNGTSNLSKADAPVTIKQSITMKIELSKESTEGVVIAQGGTNHGWSLYLQGGLLKFATRINGELTVIHSEQPWDTDTKAIVVTYKRDGILRVTRGDDVLLMGKTGGAMIEMPIDGLQVGQDQGGAVGNYEQPYSLDGEVHRIELAIGDVK